MRSWFKWVCINREEKRSNNEDQEYYLLEARGTNGTSKRNEMEGPLTNGEKPESVVEAK